MFHLLFAPDDESTAGPAVAEPTVLEPPTETPASPTEAAPPSEQEQPDTSTEEKGDSEAPKEEDEAPSLEAVRKDVLDNIDAMREADPELAKDLSERFGEKQANVDEERLDWDRQKGQEVRQTAWNNAAATAEQYAPVAINKSLVEYLGKLNAEVRGAGKALQSGDVENADAIGFDAAAWAQGIMPLIEGAQASVYAKSYAGTNYLLVGTMSEHPSYAYFTSDERKSFEQAITSGKFQDAVKLQLDVAIRAAPEEAKREAKVEATKDAGLLEQYTAFKEKLGKNGSRGVGSATSSQPKDETEARTWHATGKWTTAQMRKYLANQ